MKDVTKCPVIKQDCPLFDYSSNGRLWCNTNHDPSEWELCPFPKLREKEMKKDLTLCSNCGNPHGLQNDDAGSDREILRLCNRCFKKRKMSQCMSLIDGAKIIVELWNAETYGQKWWKKEWLEDARKLLKEYENEQ